MNKELKRLIKSDFNRISEYKSLVNKWKVYIIHPSLMYLELLRKANYYSSSNKCLYWYYRWRLMRKSLKLGYQINVNTSIGEGLYLGHRGTIIVNGNAVLGSYINIANGVTIGQENRGHRKGAPIIGSKVWIGANATIVGHINIGNNVLIAPNTYVNFDIPDNSIVVGNPGKIIINPNATEGYI
jgi:serine O-acetyltransferase